MFRMSRCEVEESPFGSTSSAPSIWAAICCCAPRWRSMQRGPWRDRLPPCGCRNIPAVGGWRADRRSAACRSWNCNVCASCKRFTHVHVKLSVNVKKEDRRPGDTRRGNGATHRGARALEAPERSASCHTSWQSRGRRAAGRGGSTFVRASPRPPRPAISEILRQAHAYHCASIDTLYNGNLSHAAAHNTSLASPQYTTHILENRVCPPPRPHAVVCAWRRP